MQELFKEDLTVTNFLSESDFERFLHSLRQLLESNQKALQQTGRSLSMPIEGFVQLFCLAYGSAFRISETLSSYPGDFDFDKRLITLNVTKTGYKKCKCAKYVKNDNGNRHLEGDIDCKVCSGKFKLRKAQYTTIHPKYVEGLKKYIMAKWNNRPDAREPIFATNRHTLWSYAKQAGKMAGLNVFEQQDDRLIEGVWTHLFRKSRAQQMMLDASSDETSDFVFELVKIKLRHSTKARDVTFRYTNKIGQKLGLNDLLEWEKKHYG